MSIFLRSLVVGESIADPGGLTIAYAALQKLMEGRLTCDRNTLASS